MRPACGASWHAQPGQQQLEAHLHLVGTTDTSAHSPSPSLKSMRLRVKLPLAVPWPAAGPVTSVTGTTTSRDRPLIDSVPATSKRPAPVAFTLLERNCACGYFGLSNHAGLTASASVSAAPKAMLRVSMVKATCAACGCRGSKLTCACQRTNRPSTGTPI
jgi:hypothetical protein